MRQTRLRISLRRGKRRGRFYDCIHPIGLKGDINQGISSGYTLINLIIEFGFFNIAYLWVTKINPGSRNFVMLTFLLILFQYLK